MGKKICENIFTCEEKNHFTISSYSRRKLLSFGDKKVTGLLKLYCKCREVQQEGKEKLKERDCFVKRNANQKNLTWDKKLASWLSKVIPLDLGYSLGKGIFVKKKTLYIFGVLLNQNSAEFSRNHSSVPRKFSKKNTCRADEKDFRIHVLTLSENSSDLCWTTVCEGEGKRGCCGFVELYSECPE